MGVTADDAREARLELEALEVRRKELLALVAEFEWERITEAVQGLRAQMLGDLGGWTTRETVDELRALGFRGATRKTLVALEREGVLESRRLNRSVRIWVACADVSESALERVGRRLVTWA